MSNGLGTSLFALTLLAVLAGLAIASGFAGLAVRIWARRRDSSRRRPGICWWVGLVVVGIGGFGVLVLYDEASPAAWLFPCFCSVGVPRAP
jgi:hypothetical protein